MPSNRSNAERGKAFVIGTKIEDNGKLYEDRTDYKVRREYKLNNLFNDYKTNDFKHW
jgi:hypothetical protein